MLLFDGPLTFREFMTHEEVPLATVFREVLTYLVGREDAVLFGAQAVNAYCEPARMTEDVDVLSTQAAGLAEALRAHLAARFHMAMRVREVVAETGFRVYQLRKPKNRHLVDVRQVERLPEYRMIDGVRVLTPVELMALKTVSIAHRGGREKGLSDRLDLARLLRTFPALRSDDGPVVMRLRGMQADESVLHAWRESIATHLEPDEDVDDE
ncbi:hypothetical protein [Pendulispora albinea]|uniref:Nucleotidyl transferase AbiEii/AbiGii toxin family protein n=1 Tax=Pendulispora albinea TaxID=2741071 RepID=A0ABZ2LK06_9BACT